MVTYSTNFMGPISLQWYRDRGISVLNGQPEVTYAGGRIDVYGLSEDDYYAGKSALGLPVMTATSFNSFSRFLSSFRSDKQLTYNDLVKAYIEAGNPEITYAPPVLQL